MQPSRDKFKFGVHGYTLLVNSYQVIWGENCKLRLMGSGEGKLTASVNSFRNLQVYLLGKKKIKFLLEPDLPTVDKFPQ